MNRNATKSKNWIVFFIIAALLISLFGVCNVNEF